MVTILLAAAGSLALPRSVASRGELRSVVGRLGAVSQQDMAAVEVRCQRPAATCGSEGPKWPRACSGWGALHCLPVVGRLLAAQQQLGPAAVLHPGALQVLWTPQQAGDFYTRADLAADYPHLVAL